jgi:hypothetical protein
MHWDMSIPFPDIKIDTLDLSYSDIRKLPLGIKAKNLYLQNTSITSLGNLESVGGRLYLGYTPITREYIEREKPHLLSKCRW